MQAARKDTPGTPGAEDARMKTPASAKAPLPPATTLSTKNLAPLPLPSQRSAFTSWMPPSAETALDADIAAGNIQNAMHDDAGRKAFPASSVMNTVPKEMRDAFLMQPGKEMMGEDLDAAGGTTGLVMQRNKKCAIVTSFPASMHKLGGLAMAALHEGIPVDETDARKLRLRVVLFENGEGKMVTAVWCEDLYQIANGKTYKERNLRDQTTEVKVAEILGGAGSIKWLMDSEHNQVNDRAQNLHGSKFVPEN